ncbi:MAG TPA: hypothetical protein VGP35_05285 [Terriglobales bacterium]|jgi:hypothetical protein|nr:hypothetical protein [Terriglobales bacterium]
MSLTYLVSYYYLWVGPHLLLASILVAMFLRRLHRQFPMFFLYAAFEMLQCGVLLGISLSPIGFDPPYTTVYSIGLAISTVIRFAVISELYRHFFRRYPALNGPGRYLFCGSIVVLLVIAAIVGVSAPSTSSNFLFNATYALDRAVSVLQCGLLISLFAFSRYFALSWRSHAFGIALGLGIFASVELATSCVWLHLGYFGDRAVNLFTMATYHLCVLIWMFYLIRRERVMSYVLTPLPKNDLEIWNNELQRLVQR